MASFRVGLVGTGFGGLVHAPAYQIHPDFELVAIAGMRSGSASAVADRLGVRGYDDWERLIQEESLDVLSIASEPRLHAPMAIAGLRAGLHILSEKPMALDSGETDAMLTLSRDMGRVSAINHEFRFKPGRQAIKRILDEGTLGETKSFVWTMGSGRFGQPSERPVGWLARREHGGGMLGAIGSHVLDSLAWWLGPALEVQATLVTDTPTRVGGLATADDGFSAILSCGSGVSGVIHYRSQWAMSSRLEIVGSQGSLSLVDDQDLFVRIGEGETLSVNLEPSPWARRVPTGTPPLVTPMLSLLDEFSRAMQGEPYRDLATFETGARTQLALDAIRESHRTGGRVRLAR